MNERMDQFIELAETLLKEQEKKNYIHERHHIFLEQWMQEQENKRLFRQKVLENITSGALWWLIVGLALVVWYAINQWFNHK